MDIEVFLPTLAFSLILLLLSELGNKAGWKLLGFFAMAVSVLCALVLSADGDLTNGATVIAAANGNFVSDFNLVAWTPILIAGGEFVVTARRIVHI